ncbi:hypothetical protein AB0G02_14430, partial [Actinosynnema sp. NPDC023658]
VAAVGFGVLVVGSPAGLALWCARRPVGGPALATGYVMDVVWRGVASRLTTPAERTPAERTPAEPAPGEPLRPDADG